MKRIYLCGGINGLSDADCNDWRSAIKLLLPHYKCVDPMRRDYRGDELASSAQIVSMDLRDIDSCDALIVNASKASWGTAMEVYHAFTTGKLVVAFTGEGVVSPWLRQHVHCLAVGLDKCVAFLKSEL